MSRSFATVSKVNSDGTVEVNFGNSSNEMSVGSIRTTTGCAGVKVGDVVVVDTFSYVPLVTGIVSTGANGVVPVSSGGTGATTAAGAKNALGVAASSHTHAAGNITSGTLSADRLPTVPVSKGGTGATDAAHARANLGLGSCVMRNGSGLTNAWLGLWNGGTSDPGYRLETCWFVNGAQRGLCVDTYNRLRFYGSGVNNWSLGNLSGDKSMTPVYRLYNKYDKMYLFTVSTSEYNNLVSAGWTGDGVAFYAFR